MTTKVRERGQDILKPGGDRRGCPICSPSKWGKTLREDQVWGHCPTNRPHPKHGRDP